MTNDRTMNTPGTRVYVSVLARCAANPQQPTELMVSLNSRYEGCEYLKLVKSFARTTDNDITVAVRRFLRRGGLRKLRLLEKRWLELEAAAIRVSSLRNDRYETLQRKALA